MNQHLFSTKLWIFLILICSVYGCTDRRVFTTSDSWYSPPADSSQFNKIEKERVTQVLNEYQLEAQNELADRSAKKLSKEEAYRFTGSKLPEGELVLLRSIVLFEKSGTIVVSVNGKEVHVHYSCLGRSPQTMKRKAIVAVLSCMPEKVFVSCSMAE